MPTPRLTVVILILAFFGPQADAAGGQEATGEAQVVDNNIVQAKQAALADALRHSVEQVVGVLVQNQFSSNQEATTSGEAQSFSQRVQDSVVQKSEGFIQSYEVLSEKREGDMYQVRVRAVVFESRVQAELQKVADLMAAAGNPAIMVHIDEVAFGRSGTPQVHQPALAALLEKELLARGFILRGQDAQISSGTDITAASALARAQGADMLIWGRVEIHDGGVLTEAETGGMDALRGQTRIEVTAVVQGINTASGEVLSAKPVQMKSMGMTEERAIYRALQGNGPNVVRQIIDNLVPDLQASFKKTAEHGQQYMVQLQGVRSYRQQGAVFLKLMAAVSGVSGVTERSFENGSLAVDVMCKCSTSELQQGIFAAAEHLEDLKSLDVSGVSGKRLSFKL